MQGTTKTQAISSLLYHALLRASPSSINKLMLTSQNSDPNICQKQTKLLKVIHIYPIDAKGTCNSSFISLIPVRKIGVLGSVHTRGNSPTSALGSIPNNASWKEENPLTLLLTKHSHRWGRAMPGKSKKGQNITGLLISKQHKKGRICKTFFLMSPH